LQAFRISPKDKNWILSIKRLFQFHYNIDFIVNNYQNIESFDLISNIICLKVFSHSMLTFLNLMITNILYLNVIYFID
jgi:hypothetical protein